MKKNVRKPKKIHFQPDFYFENTLDFCLHLGLTASDVADLTGTSIQTARRWLRDPRPPRWLLPFLFACDGRVLSPGFDGWRFNNKRVACMGWRFDLSASQIQAYSWHLDQLSASLQTIGRLKSQIADEKKPQHTAALFQFSDFKK